MRNFLIALVVLLLATTTLQLWVTQDATSQKKEMDDAAGHGDPQIGGAFTLTDQSGNVVHDVDFRGKVMVIFFGFTHCPDTCPVTVATLSKMMALLGDRADNVVPLFITLDPERDSPAAMKDFLANFDKRIMGLTGTPEQIKEVGKAYKVYSAKLDAQGNPIEDAKATDYNVDHSAYIYLMGKDGKYVRMYPYNATEQELARGVEHYLSQ